MCHTRGLIAVTPPVHKACWVLVVGRQPGRELEGCPVSAQRPKDGHHPVGRERSSWPEREVRILTARVVCPDCVQDTALGCPPEMTSQS